LDSIDRSRNLPLSPGEEATAVRRARHLLTRVALCAAAILAGPRPASAAPPEDADVRRWQTGALSPDRLQHASLSFAVGLAAGIPSEAPATAFGVAFGLGLLKELADARRTHFDAGDLAADAVGAAFAAWATAAMTR
jgi:hypothetical protein